MAAKKKTLIAELFNVHGTPDWPLVGICAALIFSGILILASVSGSYSLQRTGDSFYYLNHQLVAGFLPGLFLGGIAYFLSLDFLKKVSFLLLLGNVILLAGVFVPFIGQDFGGAHRWVGIGGFTFQPSEALKVSAIVYLASWLAAKNKGNRDAKKKNTEELKKVFLPFLAIIWVIGTLLILQPDLSTLIVITTVIGAMYFVSGTPVWQTISLVTAGAAIVLTLIKIAPYRMSRFTVFLDPSTDPLGQGFHIKQALIGIGSGGLTGVGLGLSFQKFGIIPEPMSDSVFAIFAEEAGFIGALFLLLLILAFAWRGFVIASRVPDGFANLAAIGISFWIPIQAFVNIGAMVGLLPLTGIPLPFISYGGSAIIVELIATGLLLNISRQTTK